MPFDPAIPKTTESLPHEHRIVCAKLQVSVRMWRSWWEGKPVQPLWEPVWWCLKKLHIALPYDPAIPLQGIHPEELKART